MFAANGAAAARRRGGAAGARCTPPQLLAMRSVILIYVSARRAGRVALPALGAKRVPRLTRTNGSVHRASYDRRDPTERQWRYIPAGCARQGRDYEYSDWSVFAQISQKSLLRVRDNTAFPHVGDTLWRLSGENGSLNYNEKVCN